jgi:hypothetical protein
LRQANVNVGLQALARYLKPHPQGLVFERHALGPQTHVLVVGVASYPRLKGGGAKADQGSPIGQLIAPAVSARQIAHWFIKDYHHPNAPLGSVALLLSEVNRRAYRPPGRQPVAVGIATYANLEKAAQAWRLRGDQSEESQLLFIFCGHGYGFGDTTPLLMADFDFREQNRWDQALDLGEFVAGMEACAVVASAVPDRRMPSPAWRLDPPRRRDRPIASARGDHAASQLHDPADPHDLILDGRGGRGARPVWWA